MKESKGFKMLGVCSEINFHKDILKNYLIPLGADSPGFLESCLGSKMFRSPMVEILNLPEVEMVYLIQPAMNTLSIKEGLSSEEKPSTHQSFGRSANLIKSFLPIYKHKGSHKNKFAILSVEAPVRQGAKAQEYRDIPSFRNAARRDASTLKMLSYFCASPKHIPAFMKSSFYKGVAVNSSIFKQSLKFKQDRICLDSKTSPAAKTAKSEIFTRRKKIFFNQGKFDLTTPKEVALLDRIPFPAIQESRTTNTDFKMPVFLQKKSVIPSFSAGAHNFEQVHMHSHGKNSFATSAVSAQPFTVAVDMVFSLFKTQSRKPAFFSSNTVINHSRSSETQPILHAGISSLQMHKFIPVISVIHTQHAGMKENTSFSPQLVFADRHHNSSQSFEVIKAKEDTSPRKSAMIESAGFKSHPISLESSSLTAPAKYLQAQHLVDYELIADRVYDIIENRLRMEKERE